MHKRISMSQGILRMFASFVKLVSNARSKSTGTDNGFLIVALYGDMNNHENIKYVKR